MNRKDMIIMAALINAGLLVVLFISATVPKETAKQKEFAAVYEPQVKAEALKKESIKPASKGDQIDQVISDYNVKASQKKKKEAETKALPLPALTPEPKVAQTEKKAPKKQVSSELKTVTIAKGDVLEKIAKEHGVSVQEIMKLNKLSNSRLQIGQMLKVPPKAKTLSPPLSEKATDGRYYVVRPGDNPWTIAHKNGMQVEELLELNKMDEEKAKRLRPGDRLKIK